MDGTIQEYTLEMGADTKANVLEVKQCDTNSRKARIKLVAFNKPWIIPFGCQIHINVRKTDGTLANAVCTRVDENTVMAPITEQMTTVTGTQLGELYFLGSDGDIKSQTFPIVVRPMIMDQARMESSDDFQSLQGALQQVQISTDMADAATQYATAQGDRAGDAAQRAEDAAASIQPKLARLMLRHQRRQRRRHNRRSRIMSRRRRRPSPVTQNVSLTADTPTP